MLHQAASRACTACGVSALATRLLTTRKTPILYCGWCGCAAAVVAAGGLAGEASIRAGAVACPLQPARPRHGLEPAESHRTAPDRAHLVAIRRRKVSMQRSGQRMCQCCNAQRQEHLDRRQTTHSASPLGQLFDHGECTFIHCMNFTSGLMQAATLWLHQCVPPLP